MLDLYPKFTMRYSWLLLLDLIRPSFKSYHCFDNMIKIIKISLEGLSGGWACFSRLFLVLYGIFLWFRQQEIHDLYFMVQECLIKAFQSVSMMTHFILACSSAFQYTFYNFSISCMISQECKVHFWDQTLFLAGWFGLPSYSNSC
jgi:hypothetical protein